MATYSAFFTLHASSSNRFVDLNTFARSCCQCCRASSAQAQRGCTKCPPWHAQQQRTLSASHGSSAAGILASALSRVVAASFVLRSNMCSAGIYVDAFFSLADAGADAPASLLGLCPILLAGLKQSKHAKETKKQARCLHSAPAPPRGRRAPAWSVRPLPLTSHLPVLVCFRGPRLHHPCPVPALALALVRPARLRPGQSQA